MSEPITLTGNLKTYADWDTDLGQYLQLGDAVDDEMEMHFLEVLPPACWNSRVIQIGEPHDHNGPNHCARFSTIQKHAGQWIWTGNQPRGKTVEID